MKEPTDPTLHLKQSFVACCVLAGLCGLLMGLSCEFRKKDDCSTAWRDGSGLTLAAAGVLAAALARFTGQEKGPPP